MRTRRDQDGVGPDVHAVRVGHVHPAGNVEKRLAFAIHRNLDLLGPVRRVQRPPAVTEERPGRFMMERHPEDVLAVGRKRVDDRGAAARAVRRPLDLFHLRGPSGDLVGRLGGGRGGIADRQSTDFAGGPQVAVHQRGRQQLDVGDVVEIGALGIERQIGAGIDVERQEVANRAFVLGAVESLKGSAARVGVGRGGRVDPGLQRRCQTDKRGLIRTPDTRGRHHARPQLANHPLRELGALVGSRHVERLERHVAAAHAIVVAPLAGPLDDPLTLGGARRETGRLPARRQAGGGHQAQ